MVSESQVVSASGHDRRDQIWAKVVLGAVFLLFSYTIYRAMGVFGWDDWWILVTTSSLSVLFIIVSLLGFRYSHPIIRRGYWLAAYWSGWVGVFFGAAILLDIIEHFSLWTGILILPSIAGAISVLAGIFVILYGTWQSTRAQISRITLALPSLPEFWHGKTIVFLSDLHLGDIHNERFTDRIVRQIQALTPEAIFIGGDVYDGVAGRAKELIAPLRALAVPLGVYVVTGNHEYANNETGAFLDAIKDAGIQILKNEAVDLRGITLLGVDYRSARKRADFDAILRGMAIDHGRPSILLKHAPENLDIAANYGISLVLSGHTHNGQIWPLNYYGYLFKEFYYGYHHLNGTQIYVSSGVGTNGAPFRLGTKSEIVAIKLECGM
jgi:predicted MPP superfamily phosphohydrolase